MEKNLHTLNSHITRYVSLYYFLIILLCRFLSRFFRIIPLSGIPMHNVAHIKHHMCLGIE